MQRTSVAAVDAAARELGIKRGHLYRLLRCFRADPTVTAVLPRARGRMQGARLLSPEVEALDTAAIDDFHLTRSSPKVSQLMREVGRRSVELGLAPPSQKAVTARIRLRDQLEVLRAAMAPLTRAPSLVASSAGSRSMTPWSSSR